MTWAILPYEHYVTGIKELLQADFTGSSERVVAVVGGALLEASIDQTIRERLIQSKVVNDLLGFDRPLSNVGARISLLHLLGAFDEKSQRALQAIARIRNEFAHNLDASFNSEKRDFVKYVNRLTLHEGKTHYPHHLFGPDTKKEILPIKTNRDRFIVNLQLALIILMRHRVSHHPWSNIPRTEAELLELYPNRYEA